MHFVAHFCTRLIQRPRHVFKVKLAYGERSCGVGKICKASKAKVAKLRPINPPLWPRTLNSRTEIESEKIPGTAECRTGTEFVLVLKLALPGLYFVEFFWRFLQRFVYIYVTFS